MTGPGEPAKYLPLPSGPASLCFDNDMFMKDSFDVDTFVMECRRRVPLETLRDDLSTYLKILRSAMIELINKDYADFVNLSSNLVGMDKAIGNLTTPLCELKDQVMTVKIAMDQAISAVEQKLKQREQIRQKKACLQRLMNIVQSVEKIERLLGIHSGEGGEIIQAQLNGPLIERVANEFNKLQFYVIKSTGLPLVERIRPRISNITSTLQISLEGHFLEGLDTGNTEILQQCLRTYALIDKIQDVENLFRKEKVRPYMEEVINEQNVKSTGGRPGLKGMFQQILDFVPQHCGILREVTTGGRMGAMESVRGYDFMVNAVWPEVVSNIEARTPSIFAPGNPNTFHDKFLVSMKFLDDFEALCGSQASVRRLREHPSYHIFINKWSLPVYYQIRFQEMAGSLETSLCTAFNNSADQDLFHLNVTLTLWRCVSRCWGEDVYLAPICHKLWKLSLQLISRYSTWLDECYKQEIEKRSLEAENQKMNTSVSMPNLTHTDRNNGAMDTSGTTGEGQITPATPPVTLGQILCLLSDVEKFSQQISSLFDETIKPKITAAGFEDTDNLKGSIQECSASLMSKLPRYREFIVEEISCQCSINLKQVNDVPRLYRRTNREVPVKPSTYIGNAFKPVSLFVQEHGNILGEKQKQEIFQEIFTRLAEQYFSVTSDVLLSVKKMEDSLKRLKRVRGTDKGAGSQGLTDDDKIRQQIILDIDSYGQQITGYGVQKEGLESYKKLQQLSAEAKSAMTTAQ
ncbi:conserved oligomeric Golgi complex subunit 2-like isoform X2 [Mizuhopecten yessoensis]|uniref:Conserved oligomeric Golgi complex subunit 2 n=1 Tax=Mizuhopecten yessoensis TaxID=6573 RepID=A0A210R646_MIZYE|nr:conserved oligomeric Golgi complex subunit 2-like isoform X2 [Mizuhopecten yessoensis]OWF56425.1 Conserved oligomeric Golgi complex subunit 2 [Mizuhopecten yessoensis]